MDVSATSDCSVATITSNITKCSNPVFRKILGGPWDKVMQKKDVLTVLTAISKIIKEKGQVLRAQTIDSWSTESIRHLYRRILQFISHPNPSPRKASHAAVVSILASQPDLETTHPACHQTQEHLSNFIRQEFRDLVAVLTTQGVHCARLLHCMDLFASVLPLFPTKDIKSGCECIIELVQFPNSLVVKKAFDLLVKLFSVSVTSSQLTFDLVGRLLTALYSYRPDLPIGQQQPTSSPFTSGNNPNDFDLFNAWLQALHAGCTRLVSCYGVSTTVLALDLTLGHLNKFVRTLFDLLVESRQVGQTACQLLSALVLDELHQLSTSIHHQPDDKIVKLLTLYPTSIVQAFERNAPSIWSQLATVSAHFLLLCSTSANARTLANNIHVEGLVRKLVEARDALTLSDAAASLPVQLTLLPSDQAKMTIGELDRALCLALKYLGPARALSPDLFNLPGIVDDLESYRAEPSRWWLIGLLLRAKFPAESIDDQDQLLPHQPLTLFAQLILPQADRCVIIVQRLIAASGTVPARNSLVSACLTTASQLWSLLPSLLTLLRPQHASDWSILGTGGLGKRLVDELTNTPALRPTVLKSLRLASQLAVKSETGCKTMRGGVKMTLPALLTLFEQADGSDLRLKQLLGQTLGAYLPCLSEKTVFSPVPLLMKKLDETGKPIYLELLRIIAPHLQVNEINSILGDLVKFLSDESPVSTPTLRKRAYQVLEAVCLGSTVSSRAYLESNLHSLLTLVDQLNNNAANSSNWGPVDSLLANQLARLSTTSQSRPSSVPCWKPRLRCLSALLGELVKQEAAVNVSAADGLLECPSLKHFATSFLPELLPLFRNANGVVRKLVGQLLCSLVFAFAGRGGDCRIESSQANDDDLQSAFDHHQSVADDSATTYSRTAEEVLIDNEDDDDVTEFEDNDGDASNNDQIDSARQICRALDMVASRILPFLPPTSSSLDSSSQLAVADSAGRALLVLLGNHRLRRACLLATSDSHLDTIEHAFESARELVKSRHRPLTRLGLKLLRLLLSFIGSQGSIGLPDYVASLELINSAHAHGLRFNVKAIIEKLIKKFGRRVIQQMFSKSSQYAKVTRNSAKLLARRERDRTSVGGGGDDDTRSLASSIGTASLVSGKSSTRMSNNNSRMNSDDDTSTIKSRSLLPPRVCVSSLSELLESDDDGQSDCHLQGDRTDAVKKSKSRTKTGSVVSRNTSLASELQSLAQTSGLCRRSARKMLVGEDDGSSSDDDDHHLMPPPAPPTRGIRRKVRFTDNVSQSGSVKSRVSKSGRQLPQPNAVATGNSSDLWLVEGRDDVVDLSDPRSLSIHSTLAADAADALAQVSSHGVDRFATPKPKSSFPVIGGKLVIEKPGQQERSIETSDWSSSVADNDADNIDNEPSSWVSVKQPPPRGKRSKTLPGQQYASEKARGDMRKPGLPAPYAFVKLGSGLGDKSMKRTSEVDRKRLLRSIGAGGSVSKKAKRMNNKSRRR